MYTLYSMSGSCSSAIHALLVSLDVPVTLVDHQEVENYRQINPTGQVPALDTPDGLLTEGAAICLYLIEKHNIHLECDEITFHRQMMFNYATLHPAYSKMFTVHFAMEPSNEKTQLMTLLASKTAELWEILDQRLAQHDFLLGKQVSVLDYLLTLYANWGNTFPYVTIPLGENVLRVIRHVADLPTFKKVAAKEKMRFSLPSAA
jgi:glutathione S-transferase